MVKLRRVFEILLICTCLTIASTEIIQKRQHLLDHKRCHYRKLILFDKFNKANLEKLISCKKLVADEKISSTHKNFEIINLIITILKFLFNF